IRSMRSLEAHALAGLGTPDCVRERPREVEEVRWHAVGRARSRVWRYRRIVEVPRAGQSSIDGVQAHFDCIGIHGLVVVDVREAVDRVANHPDPADVRARQRDAAVDRAVLDGDVVPDAADRGASAADDSEAAIDPGAVNNQRRWMIATHTAVNDRIAVSTAAAALRSAEVEKPARLDLDTARHGEVGRTTRRIQEPGRSDGQAANDSDRGSVWNRARSRHHKPQVSARRDRPARTRRTGSSRTRRTSTTREHHHQHHEGSTDRKPPKSLPTPGNVRRKALHHALPLPWTQPAYGEPGPCQPQPDSSTRPRADAGTGAERTPFAGGTSHKPRIS